MKPGPKTIAEHGTATRYQRGCRCRPCTDAGSARCRDYRQRKQLGLLKSPNQPEHGRGLYLYNHGCRCALCYLAKSWSERDYRLRYPDLIAERRRQRNTQEYREAVNARRREHYASDWEYRSQVNARNRRGGKTRRRVYLDGQEVNLASPYVPDSFRQIVEVFRQLRTVVKEKGTR